MVFEDILGLSKSKYRDQFLPSGRDNNLYIYYLSQSYFDLPKRTIRNNSNKSILFIQPLKSIENIYRDVGVYDLRYKNFIELWRKSWEEDYKYLCIDWSKKKRDQGSYCICNASKNPYTQDIPEPKLFSLL